MKRMLKRILNKLLRIFQAHPVYVSIKSVDNSNLLKGLNCLITGGKGIGLAIAKKIVSCGGTVILAGRDEKALKAAVNQLGDKSSYVVFDLNNIHNYDKFLEDVLKLNSGLNSMILNAGISHHEGSITNVYLEGFEKQIRINYMSCYFLTKEFIRKVGKGNLLYLTSETADMGCEIPYGLSKASLNSLIKAIGAKYYQKGIRANGIAPGQTVTNMVRNANSDSNDLYRDNSLGRYTLPEEIAEVAVFLLSDSSDCISGEIIHTNAGNHLRIQ